MTLYLLPNVLGTIDDMHDYLPQSIDLAVNKIDGELRAVPAQGFLVEPGVHTINGRATLDASKCQPLTAYQQIGRATDLEVNFEPGRIYYIAYDHKSQNTEEWRLVVWKVESDNPPQTFIQ